MPATKKAAVKLLDKTIIAPLIAPITKVWGEIADDLISSTAECGDRMTNAIAIETCIDADRLVINGQDPGADKYLEQTIKDYGYESVFKTLCKHIHLY